MRHLLIITTVLISINSCTSINIHKTLNDVETYIMERPDSALSVLESIDRKELKSSRSKAHHALLHVMALDKNYIDVKDDSIALVAANYYQSRGPKRNFARALYYLGKSYYYQDEYDKAILEYSKAERVAAGCDSLYLGFIYSGMSYTYNCNYNSYQEILYAQKASEMFSCLNLTSYTRALTYRLAVAYHNNDNYEKALEEYNRIIESSSEIDHIYIQAILGKAHSSIETANPDYFTIQKLFHKAEYDLNAELEERDFWAWAYSLYRIGKHTEAENIIRRMTTEDVLLANFWKARIYEYLNNFELAYKHIIASNNKQNNVVEKILEESLAIYQRDYYKSTVDIYEYKIQNRNMALIGTIIITVLLLIIIYLSISNYIKKQKEERNKLIEYAEEIKRQLNGAEQNDYPTLKSKYIAIYKSRFETIGKLSEQYIQAEGRTDIESLIYKKVVTLISEIKNDSANRKAFEAMLDNDLDMIMTRLRQEMPKFKEIDYSIFSYLIVGFDATTISRLIDMSTNNIYAHKRRIRLRIKECQPEHAAQFLEMLD